MFSSCICKWFSGEFSLCLFCYLIYRLLQNSCTYWIRERRLQRSRMISHHHAYCGIMLDTTVNPFLGNCIFARLKQQKFSLLLLSFSSPKIWD